MTLRPIVTLVLGVLLMSPLGCAHRASDTTSMTPVQASALCDPAQALALGAQGGAYPDRCPEAAHPDFARVFDTGRQLLALRAQVFELERELADRHEDLLELKSTAYELEAMLVNASPAMDRRLRVLLELRDLSRQERDLEREIENLAAERDFQQQLLASLELSVRNS